MVELNIISLFFLITKENVRNTTKKKNATWLVVSSGKKKMVGPYLRHLQLAM